MQFHENMEESTVPTTSVEENMKETDNSHEDQSSITCMKNDDVALVNLVANCNNIVSFAENQTEDEKISSEMVDSGKESTANLTCDKEESKVSFTACGSEATVLPSYKDQSAEDLLAQEDELQELGISVVDQLSLERDVQAAVSSGSYYFIAIT